MRTVTTMWPLRALLFVGLVALATGRADNEPGKVAFADVEAAWKQREVAFESAEIKWQEDYFLPKGSYTRLWADMLTPGQFKKLDPDNKGIPPADLTFKVNGHLRVKGNTLEVERNAPAWNRTTKDIRLAIRKCQFNGTTYREFEVRGEGKTAQPTGRVESGAICPVAKEPWCRPVMLALRPHAKSFRPIIIDDLVITGRSLAIKGVNCIELQWRPPGKSQPDTIVWLDPARGFIIARLVIYHLGKIIHQTDISYQQRSSGFWAPVAWQIVSNGTDEKVSTTITGTVQHWEDSAKPNTSLRFPPKTRVFDFTQPKDRQEYVVREDGGRFPISRGDVGKMHDQLVDEMAAESARPIHKIRTILFWLLLAANTSVAAMILWRLSRRPAQSTPVV